jgi:D-3-phosphoglycerate dehydrogenase
MTGNKVNRPIIVITDADYYAPGFVEEKMPRLLELGQVRLAATKDETELIDALSEADVAVIRRVRMTRQVFAACPRLVGVVKFGAGVEKIDIPAATEYGVIVANSPAVTIAVAEATLTLMLALTKPLFAMVEAARSGVVPDSDVRGTELFGKTLGVVGCGRIGSHLARIGQGLGMTILAYDAYVPDVPGCKMVDLHTLLRESDIVSLHIPDTPETHHLIDQEKLRLMKPTAILINTARGRVVDEDALYRALRDGRLRGAGLDVVEHEPITPDHPLLTLPNVVVTPHALARTWEALDKVVAIIQDEVEAILKGEWPEYTLNRSVQRKTPTHPF